MTGVERLRIVQEKLIADGVKDVKFTWGPDAHKLSHDELCGQVADFLQAYIDGKYEVIQSIGDAPEQCDGDVDR